MAEESGDTPSTRQEVLDQLIIDVDVIRDDIKDFIDEISFDEMAPDKVITRLESTRTLFRTKHYKLRHYLGETYQERFGQEYDDITYQIKSAIRHSKDNQSKSIAHERMAIVHQEKAMMFQVEATGRTLADLHHQWGKSIKVATEDQIIQWKEDLQKSIKMFDKASEKYQELLMFPAGDTNLIEAIADLGKKFNTVISLKETFVKELNHEIDVRELNKRDLLKESKLNIKLSKFFGYDSELDIYTFQLEFEKLYSRTTTRRTLPDLLINNYLSEPALSLVRGLDDINEVWRRLKATYGDTAMLLSRKTATMDKMDSLNKMKDPEKIIAGISRIINLMRDLLKLASKHRIEKNLFYGDAIERIYKLMGESRLTRWFEQSCDLDLNEKPLWTRLLMFLEKEVKIQQQRLLLVGKENIQSSARYHKSSFQCESKTTLLSDRNDSCFLCGDKIGVSDHVATLGPGGSKIIQYFSCRSFVEKTPAQRFLMVRKKGFCFQCLLPGANGDQGKHKEGKCQRDFVCPHQSHLKYPKKKHVLLCEEHKNSTENQELLERYKGKCISRNNHLPSFSKDIKLSFHSEINVADTDADVGGDTVPEFTSALGDVVTAKTDAVTEFAGAVTDIADRGIYLFQSIKLNGELFTIFFDTGCSDFIVSQDAVKRLGPNAILESRVPVTIGGVGGSYTQSRGLYRVRIPLTNGEIAILSGTCLPKITAPFPEYPLAEAQKEFYKNGGHHVKRLPRLPEFVGGRVDLMIGIKYLRYHPKSVLQLSSGLTIYKSVFRSADGTTGVVGGPHESFTQTHSAHCNSNPSFLSHSVDRYQHEILPVLIASHHAIQSDQDHHTNSYPVNPLKSFDKVERTGSQITYRCITCRDCKICKTHDSVEAVSLKEETEQAIINASVKIDIDTCITYARLPFIFDPIKRLSPNKYVALRIYNQQLRKLNNPVNSKDKEDILNSEAKLQKLGFVDYVRNLPNETQTMLKDHPIQNFIPWRAVWKPTSLSTPCRVVFDASQATSSGYSLNDILAKGKNGLNKLQEIVIRWSARPIGIHTDISKMYNTIHLDERDWCLQRYVWEQNLDPSKIPEEKVIKTLIYGVRPSGNQAEYGLREVAKMSSNEFPIASNIIQKDVYVDDCITGESTPAEANKRADELELVMNRGGFRLKGITLSGQDPQESLSDDGKSISVAGMKWFSKNDLLSLNIVDLNFSKRQRGKKSANATNVFPQKLTRRHCASKVGEIYDLLGKITPITASFKLDLHDLVSRKLNWDDPIPDELRSTWVSNFQFMQDLKNLYFKRTIVPEDAISLDIETIDAADASRHLACAAIYTRIERKNGDYLCQLVFARSKIIPDGMSQPRAELVAALLNAHTGEIVARSFGTLHKRAIKLSDSQIVLHWLSNEEKPLKQWVRNRVIEIRRLTSPEHWFYDTSKDMIANIGTRRGSTIEDVEQNSIWINGFDWMSKPNSLFPITSVKELKLSANDISKVCEETYQQQTDFVVNQMSRPQILPTEVEDHYKTSQYLIDPNRYRFSKVVRIMGYVMKFIRKCRKSRKSEVMTPSTVLSSNDIKEAKKYYFRKCSDEVRKLSKKKYENISADVDGILMYTGRIMPCNEITITGKFTSTMKDLSSTSFCVPLVDKYSPVAYSIVNEVHWYNDDACHRGVETTLRYVMKQAYILEVRSIIKRIKRSCQRCRYLAKKTLEVVMGPVSQCNVTIAPAFYATQVDLSGPYKAYSNHNKRSTIKIWLVVFCCCTTSTTSIKVMDDYSTSAFVQAFIRFSSDVGFPKILLCDEGSQLVKGSKEMKLNFKDMKNQLHNDIGIEFSSCPVGGHNFHGKVERKIREINKSLEKSVSNERLSLLQWETVAAKIANCINNLPICVRDVVSDFEVMDLLTPNRLRLGRNNERSPEGQMVTTAHPDKILKSNENTFSSWFEVWLLCHVPKLLEQDKWFRSDLQPAVGDVVLFLKQESNFGKNYQYGMIEELEPSKDGVVRKVLVRYKNHQEQSFRFTKRSIRSLVLIHSIGETDIMTELGTMAAIVDAKVQVCQQNSVASIQQ